jgi:hypothetical protein
LVYVAGFVSVLAIFARSVKMFKICKAAIGAAVLALGLSAGFAQAVPITGSITISDGLLGLPAAPSGSVVSALAGISHDGLGNSGGCTTDFVGSCGAANATMTDWLFGGGFPIIIVINGFSFNLNGHGAITPSPLVCASNSCADNLLIAGLFGTVSKAGFDDTAFTGSLSLSGSCVSSDNVQCTSDISGGYTYSLSATGTIQTPEPTTLALIGIALAGLGFIRRRNA